MYARSANTTNGAKGGKRQTFPLYIILEQKISGKNPQVKPVGISLLLTFFNRDCDVVQLGT